MKLDRLRAENIRNIVNASLELDPGVNLVTGLNGSGKTSILEAVYFLGTGRSFRSAQIDPLMRREESYCLVSGEVSSLEQGSVSLGFRREADGQREMRINGKSQHQASELARYLPNLLLGPDTVELVRGPPPLRRNFLNWGVFHVEPSFNDLWRQSTRALKQRNALLRDEASDAEIEPWSLALSEYGSRIDVMRESYMSRFLPVFTDTYRFLLDLEGVKCAYRRGWDSTRTLQEVFLEQLPSDKQRRFTQSGFQRADLRLTIAGNPIAQICSRGELKLISWAMVLAQGFMLSSINGTKPLFLVDDLIAELDKHHQRAIAKLLEEKGGQVLVTGTDDDLLKALWGSHVGKMFHVEQGSINEQEMTE